MGGDEISQRVLKLAVEYPSIGDNDDAVEDPAVIIPMECGKMKREPCDGVRLTAASTVLDEITLAGPMLSRMGDTLLARLPLLVARKDDAPLSGALLFLSGVFAREPSYQV